MPPGAVGSCLLAEPYESWAVSLASFGASMPGCHDLGMHGRRPNRSWLLAFVYFGACWIVAALSGAVGFVGDGPWIEADRGFLLIGLGALGAAAVGYWAVWPQGTENYGRPLRVGAATAFGIVHGVSEGLLYLAIWIGVGSLTASSWARVIGAVAAIAAYNGLWRTFVWDVWVTPPHNLAEWNLRKIGFVHLPVLTLALIHLALFDSGFVFLAVQVVALVGSAIFMRFPAPRDPAPAAARSWRTSG